MSLKNFTIILPGGCNANCQFCDDKGDRNAPIDYLLQVEDAINSLPDDFNQVSITGGEPTISPFLLPVLGLVRDSLQFDKVVLTTNGVRLKQVASKVLPLVDHINISRHAVSEKKNAIIFGTKGVIKDVDIKAVCEQAHNHLVDVNINVVYTEDSDWTEAQVYTMCTKYAALGVDKFAFRYDQRNDSLAETYLEKIFSTYPVIYRGGCPVCRSHTIMLAGAPVTFKAAYNEPSQALNGSEGLYELVLHEDGTLAEDWSKNMATVKKPKTVRTQRRSDKLFTEEEVQRRIRAALRERPATVARVLISDGCGRSTGC